MAAAQEGVAFHYPEWVGIVAIAQCRQQVGQLCGVVEGEIEAVALIYLPLYEHFGHPRIAVAVCHGIQPPTLVVQFFIV